MSRCRPSRASELSRAASALVKVLCKPCDSATRGREGKGHQKGKSSQQGKALASFHEWFGSITLDQYLVRLVPCPSVVEAIVKRNKAWLATAPLRRDPSVFTAAEQAEGQAPRDMAYKIQWNVKSSGVFPILLANTRVDWLGIDYSTLSDLTGRHPQGCFLPASIGCLARCPTAKGHNAVAWQWHG